MITLNVSQARQQFLNLVNRAYAGEEFLIVKNKIAVARLSAPVKPPKKTKKKRILPEAKNLLSHLKGSSVDIVNKWRREEERRSYAG